MRGEKAEKQKSRRAENRTLCRRRSIAIPVFCFSVFLFFCFPFPCIAQETPATDQVSFIEITPQTRQAIDRGLAYLATIQEADGSFGGRQGHGVAVTALGCLALMADGNLPGRGRYGDHVDKGLDFILDNAQPSGLLVADMSGGPMYGHGFATLFLAEVYGMTGDQRCREALIKAVRLIIASQNKEGGWRYQPLPYDADISVTICQIMALRAARMAGISVPKETIDQAIQYVRRCQNEDGGFNYTLGGGGSAFPRSAAGVASLYYAGIYEDDALVRGLRYLLSQKNDGANNQGHFHYGHYYAVQAMFLAGGEYWSNWYPWVRDQFIASQQADGRWASPYGDGYGSAMALIVLQVPNRLLPIFQR